MNEKGYKKYKQKDTLKTLDKCKDIGIPNLEQDKQKEKRTYFKHFKTILPESS